MPDIKLIKAAKEHPAEAQRLLYHSDLSDKEIAGHLWFNALKYFTRLFSKMIGKYLAAFRKG